MKVSGLSEKDIKKISKELDHANIVYQVGVDQEIMKKNQEQKKDALSYLNPASVSENILWMEISDIQLKNLKNKKIIELLESYGFYLGRLKLME
jgi:hypothetical protein